MSTKENKILLRMHHHYLRLIFLRNTRMLILNEKKNIFILKSGLYELNCLLYISNIVLKEAPIGPASKI